jgi:hypothetical protein
VLLDVATLVASEADLAEGLSDRGSDGGSGAGMAGIGSSGEDVVVAALVVIGKAGGNVASGGMV